MTLPLVSVILAAATWYLTSMAEISRWAWSRYPDWLLGWASCPACAGAWWCAGWALLLGHVGWSWFGFGPVPGACASLLWGTVCVPLVARALDWSLRTLGQPAPVPSSRRVKARIVRDPPGNWVEVDVLEGVGYDDVNVLEDA